jgi:hypothetical protein
MVLVNLHTYVGVCVCVFVCQSSYVCRGVGVCVYVCACVCKYKCRNAGLSDIRSVRYQNEKTNDARTGPVPDQAEAVRHFLVQHRTEIMDVGMLMPALVSSMPLPSYAYDANVNLRCKLQRLL